MNQQLLKYFWLVELHRWWCCPLAFPQSFWSNKTQLRMRGVKIGMGNLWWWSVCWSPLSPNSIDHEKRMRMIIMVLVPLPFSNPSDQSRPCWWCWWWWWWWCGCRWWWGCWWRWRWGWCWWLFHFLIFLISQNPVARQGPEKSHWHVMGIGTGIFTASCEKNLDTKKQQEKQEKKI